MTAYSHVPVLEQRCLDLLAPAISHEGAIMVDATLGLGGHTESALERFPHLRVVGFDRDTEALDHSRARLARFAGRVDFVHAVYDRIEEELSALMGGRTVDLRTPGDLSRYFRDDIMRTARTRYAA